MKRSTLCVLLLGISCCNAVPRDQSGTLERVRGEGILRVGMISGAAARHEPRLAAFIRHSATAVGVRPLLLEGAAEPLLLMLEAGEVDLVVGEFDRSSPWSARVHLLPPLTKMPRGDHEIEITAAVRNGENGLIMILEREAAPLSVRR